MSARYLIGDTGLPSGEAAFRIPRMNLFAANILALAAVVTISSSQFAGRLPLWAIQAPYFAIGLCLVVLLIPVQLWIVKRVARFDLPLVVEAGVVGLGSSVLGSVVGVAFALVSTFVPGMVPTSGGSGWSPQIVIGLLIALMVGALSFCCGLVGRLLAPVFDRVTVLPVAVLVLAFVNLLLALWVTVFWG